MIMIGFVILHYQTINDTQNCVDSILKNTNNALIVIVDNASPNGSGSLLKDKYSSFNNIVCLLMESNQGFAKGNNYGYRYIKEHFDCEFICCINNDTLLDNNDFETRIQLLYEQYEFGVLAPLVVLKDNSIQSFNTKIHDIPYYENEIKVFKTCSNYSDYTRSRGLASIMFGCAPGLMKGMRRIKQRIKRPYDSCMLDVVLHGCFLIFSPSFIAAFEEPFDSRTFMYREEELLYLRTKRAGLTTLYCEDICVRHMEDASTDATYTNKETKYQFVRENQIESIGILLSELRNYNDN